MPDTHPESIKGIAESQVERIKRMALQQGFTLPEQPPAAVPPPHAMSTPAPVTPVPAASARPVIPSRRAKPPAFDHKLSALVEDRLAMEQEEAKAAGMLGYMARALVRASLPHSQVKGNEFTRRNGIYTLSLWSPAELPYGHVPRLLLIWLTTEAVKTKSPELVLGPTLSSFMRDLDLLPTGGRWGSIARLRSQMERLFSCHVSCSKNTTEETRGVNFNVAKEHRLWWDPHRPDQAALWQSTVTLSTDFFQEIIDRPVPVDIRALKALGRSPLALDIYCWLTFRMMYLRQKTEIPWPVLALQFGADYGRPRAFKEHFLKQLGNVRAIYDKANVEAGDRGLMLKPSPPHVPRLALHA